MTSQETHQSSFVYGWKRKIRQDAIWCGLISAHDDTCLRRPSETCRIYLEKQRLIIGIAVVANCLGLIVKNIDEHSLIDYCNFNKASEWRSSTGKHLLCKVLCDKFAMQCTVLLSRAKLMKGGFRLLLTNDMPDVEGSGALHHIQNDATICSQMLPPLHLRLSL